MGFFSSFVNADESIKQCVKRGFDVLETINSHVQWKVSLERYVNGTSDEKFDIEIICRDDQCKLGKWIHGSALECFQADDEGFKTLRNDHAHFHVVASQVVANVQAKKKDAAENLMHGEYAYASRKVVHALTELSKQLTG